jgi:hypothetical protein
MSFVSVECVIRAAPEDGPLESKHVVPHMLINSCCVDGRIGIYWSFLSKLFLIRFSPTIISFDAGSIVK